jgi:hypothetical protein
MNLKRALSYWLLIITAESVSGTLRRLFLLPAVGGLKAHQIGVAAGCVIIFTGAWLFAGRTGLSSRSGLLLTGALWVVLTTIFEFGLGMLVGYSGERMLADYDLSKGGLMGFGLTFMLFAPLLAARIRGRC